jgi:D-alanyl-D-alanine dipeptidase
MMRAALAALAFAFAASCAAPPATSGRARPDSFVDAAQVVPALVVDMRYASANNFVGRRIVGYEAPVCLLTRQAASALAAVQRDLAASGRGLKVYDCYRPARAVADFAAWARDLDDQRTKAEYYPNVPKDQLFALGYIAERSGHSRGSTLDVTLIDLATGAELDMGTAEAQANRRALQEIMIARGFRPLREEWWHFTLNEEPYPETYFDFPVR